MDVLGTWELTLATSMGPQHSRMHVTAQDDGFRGRMENPAGDVDIVGSVDGDRLKWDVKLTRPIPLTVRFDVNVDGNVFRGRAKMGLFGKADVSGRRVSEQAEPPESDTTDKPEGIMVTSESTDPMFHTPYIIANQWRRDPEPHRYIHGGFEGTDARFSVYFPPAERYRGRFFHNTYPLAESADVGPFPIAFDVAVGDLGFCFDSGAYYLQTNLGGDDGKPPADPTIAAFRVNAAAAKYSRLLATELYGEHRPYGYLYGGSGGAYQVIGSAENTEGVWDGFLPYVIGTPNVIPSVFSVRMHALRILNKRDKLPEIVDAVSPGGSGDPCATLNEEERAALAEATRLGFPVRGWWDHADMTGGYLAFVAGIVPLLDPEYIDDFWNRPGYLGADASAAVGDERRQFETTITSVELGLPTRIELAETPDWDCAYAHLVALDGDASGRGAPIGFVNGHRLELSYSSDQTVTQALKPGDSVRLDNEWALALQTYHRHQVPTPDLYGWNQFRDASGDPIYPQRALLTGPIAAGSTAGSVPDGRINGKLLMVQNLMDIDAFGWHADWYRSQVQRHLGKGFEEQFALWFVDHARHDNPATPTAQTQVVGYSGVLQQGLRDLSAWVEAGVRPAQTRYRVDDARIELPAAASERGGVQPVVLLLANGGPRADVEAGETVGFEARVELPPSCGRLVAAEWDFDGSGTFAESERLDLSDRHIVLTRQATYSESGTHFAVVRVTTQRNPGTRYGRVQNLARARVVVSERGTSP